MAQPAENVRIGVRAVIENREFYNDNRLDWCAAVAASHFNISDISLPTKHRSKYLDGLNYRFTSLFNIQ